MRDEPVDPVIAAALERGSAMAAQYNGFRDALFEPLTGIFLIGGEAGLRASVEGVILAVMYAVRRQALGLPPIDGGEVLPFPPQVKP